MCPSFRTGVDVFLFGMTGHPKRPLMVGRSHFYSAPLLQASTWHTGLLGTAYHTRDGRHMDMQRLCTLASP